MIRTTKSVDEPSARELNDRLADSARAAIPRKPVNFRSLLLGLAGVVFICGLTPYNDYVLSNGSLLASYIPSGMLLFVIGLILLINLPLAAWAPRHALNPSEAAVAVSMALVSCSIPSVGLMGFLPAHLIGMLVLPSQNQPYEELLQRLDLPSWMFPRVSGATPVERATDPVVQGYVSRIAVENDTLIEHVRAVPWSAWVVPAVTWGILFAMVAGLVLCLCIVLRRQWIENERLPFPLATVFLSLIEPKENGSMIGGKLLGSRGFQVAFATVFAIHVLNGLNRYSPLFPAIPLTQEVGRYFADTPLRYTELVSSPLRVQFILVGVMYFVQSRMSLSLWLFFLLGQFMMLVYGAGGESLSNAMRTDQQFGSLVVYGIMILWIGRRHYAMVGRLMIGRSRLDDGPADPLMPLSLAGWGLVACSTGIGIFLWVAGASAAGAIVIVMMLLLLFTVMARIIAETGLPVGEIPVPMRRAWDFLLTEMPGGISMRTTPRSYFFTSLFTGLFTWDMREAMPVYGTHAIKIADATFPRPPLSRQHGGVLVAALGLALLVGFVTAGASMLYVEYTHAVTLDSEQTFPLNGTIIINKTSERMLEPTMGYMTPGRGSTENFSRSGHFTFGALITLFTAVMQLRYVNWPLHPAGFLVANTGPMRLMWFSIFIGWLLKVLIVRFGGGALYTAARPVFLGLILGEAAGAALWLVVSQLLHVADIPFHAIRLT